MLFVVIERLTFRFERSGLYEHKLSFQRANTTFIPVHYTCDVCHASLSLARGLGFVIYL